MFPSIFCIVEGRFPTFPVLPSKIYNLLFEKKGKNQVMFVDLFQLTFPLGQQLASPAA